MVTDMAKVEQINFYVFSRNIIQWLNFLIQKVILQRNFQERGCIPEKTCTWRMSVKLLVFEFYKYLEGEWNIHPLVNQCITKLKVRSKRHMTVLHFLVYLKEKASFSSLLWRVGFEVVLATFDSLAFFFVYLKERASFSYLFFRG